MENTHRRNFLKITTAGVVGTSIGVALGETSVNVETEKLRGQETHQGNNQFNLGMASYTFRNFSLDETLTMTHRLGLNRIALKSHHLPLESSVDEIRAAADKVKAANIELYGCGVVYMKNEAEVHRAFDYAEVAGMRIIIGVPEHHLLELVNQKVQEFDIKLAIHNHGPGDERYPSPQSAYDRIKDLDHRMGLCLDIGHTVRIGLDPVEAAEKFFDRLFDVHIKDVSAAAEEGKTVEIGRGIIDIPKFLQALLKINYSGTLAFEFEKDETETLPGVAESVGYIRGVLAVI
ncbi:sugar phosphate isomerase/epimerase [candidate division KSB1 bacterium]|nr:sugar phosphate isomerase/epimerase [candidate division KSB1 bacterium]